MNLVWTPKARRDLRRIHRRREDFSTKSSADLLVARLAGRVRQLEHFPDSGRLVPEFDNPYLRELVEQDFRIIYERFADRIEVVSILPGRMLMDTQT